MDKLKKAENTQYLLKTRRNKKVSSRNWSRNRT
jgi:hypothetical protein